MASGEHVDSTGEQIGLCTLQPLLSEVLLVLGHYQESQGVHRSRHHQYY